MRVAQESRGHGDVYRKQVLNKVSFNPLVQTAGEVGIRSTQTTILSRGVESDYVEELTASQKEARAVLPSSTHYRPEPMRNELVGAPVSYTHLTLPTKRLV